MEENEYFCTECNNEVENDFEFCPNCGTIFKEDVFCENHPDQEAVGICVICNIPFCDSCCESVNNLFLCEEHGDVEIFMSTAKLKLDHNLVENTYLYDLLVKEGLHPIKHSYRGRRDSTSLLRYSINANDDSEASELFIPIQEYPNAMLIVDDIVKQNKKQIIEEIPRENI